MLAALLASALGQASGIPLDVVLDRSANLRVSEEGEPVCTIGFQLFRTGWAQHTPTQAENGQGNPTTAQLNWPGGSAVVIGQVTQVASGLQFTVTATPNADVGTETTCLGTYLPTSRWGGSTAYVDGVSYPIPEVYGGNAWPFGGNARTLRMVKGDLEITIEGATTRGSLLQDSRQWGPNLDWRYGNQGGTWTSGTQRSYTVTLKSSRPMNFATQAPYTITAGPDWAALENPLDVVSGSALDWAPKSTHFAGHKGWVQVSGDRFVFENDPTPQRFYGANLCFSACYLSKKEADVLAQRLQRMGYNSVRLHHYDVELSGGWTNSGSSSTNLTPAKLDQLHYLMAALKKRGIYIAIDLFTIRQLRNNEILPGILGTDEYKALQLVHQGARNNWLAFATNLLDSTNPYTGLKLKDDPALAWICLVNENNQGSAARDLPERTQTLFNQAWQAAGNTGNWTYTTDQGARFGAELHAQTYAWMKTQLRNLGVKALLTDVNGWWDQRALAGHRNNLDFVDNHWYWDHPVFLGTSNWQIPSRGANGGGMATKALGGGLQNLALTRVAGKPFMVSEFNFTAPNRFRGEGGLLMGAVAARQDWDSVFRFAWSHGSSTLFNPEPFDFFNAQSDPALLASERAIISLFLRRDLEPATDEGTLWVDPNGAGAASGFDAPMKSQLFGRRLFSSTTTGGNGDLGAPSGSQPVTLDQTKGILAVNSPRTLGFLAPVGASVTAGGLSGVFSGHRGALWVSSLDKLAVAQSRRMLVTFITDIQNSNIRYSGPDRDVVEDWGTTPHLVRVGSAQVTLMVDNPAAIKVYRLDMAGNRGDEVAVTTSATTVSFTVTISGPGGATLYHEIVKGGDDPGMERGIPLFRQQNSSQAN